MMRQQRPPTAILSLQVIGQKRRALSGFSRVAVIPHAGVIFDCELVQVGGC